MKLAVFGASGRTGRIFTQKALEAGNQVRALVRKPEAFDTKHKELSIIKGDFTSKEDLAICLEGCDAVVSLVGHTRGSSEGFQTRGTSLLLDLMNEKGIGRIMTLTGGGVRDPEKDQPKFMDRFVVFAMKNLAGKGTRNALIDGLNHAELVRDFKGEWTIVRGPMLTDDPPKGNTEVGMVGTVKGFKLTRSDLAAFMVKELDQKQWIRQMPFVTNG
jgi:hypothetical protein